MFTIINLRRDGMRTHRFKSGYELPRVEWIYEEAVPYLFIFQFNDE